MSGKICVDELERVKRIARTDCIRTPKFFSDMKKYKDRLYRIGCSNGILGPNKQKVSKLTMSTLSPRNFIDEQNGLDGKQKQQQQQQPQTTRSIESYSNLLFTKAKNLISPVTTSINTSRSGYNSNSNGNTSKSTNNLYEPKPNYEYTRATEHQQQQQYTSSNSYDSNGPLTTRSNNVSRANYATKDQPTPRVLKRNLNEMNENVKHTRNNMNQNEIKNYINKEIVAKTNSRMDYRPPNPNVNDGSTLCNIL